MPSEALPVGARLVRAVRQPRERHCDDPSGNIVDSTKARGDREYSTQAPIATTFAGALVAKCAQRSMSSRRLSNSAVRL